MTSPVMPNMPLAQRQPSQPRRPGLYNALQQTQPASPGVQRSTLQASPAPAQRTQPAPRPPMSGSPTPAPARSPASPTNPGFSGVNLSGQPLVTQNNPGQLGQYGQAISAANRISGQNEINNAGKALGIAQGTYGQFEGPIQQSPFYKALYNTGVESTSSAYDAADAAMRARASAAGFGYAQPVEQGAEGQLRSQEAEALARVPEQATIDTAPLALEAARGTAGIGQEYGGMGTSLGQQGLGYFGAGMQGVESQAGINEQRKKDFLNAIAGIGQDAALFAGA